MNIVFWAALIAATIFAPPAGAAEMKFLHTTAIKPPVDVLIPIFERNTGNTIVPSYGPAGAIVQRVRSGEEFDAMIATAAQVGDLETDGVLVKGSKSDLAKVGIGLYVKKGAAKPDISSVENFKRALLNAKSVAFIDPASGGASGIYIFGLLQRLDIAEEVRSKLRTPRAVAAVFDSVASGEAELGLGQLSEIVVDQRIELAGMLPSEIQNITLFAVGVGSASKNKHEAAAFAKFLAAPEAEGAFKKFGFERP